jgi:hypothetical protein
MGADRKSKAGKAEKASRDAMNRGLDKEQDRLEDPDRRPPHHEEMSPADASHAERPSTPQEDDEEDIAHLENPPQAEGPRERSNKSV